MKPQITTTSAVQAEQNGLQPLTDAEQKRLVELESRNDELLKTANDSFVEVGRNLKEIRDSKLYRGMFATFDDYLKTIWKMSPSSGYWFINGAKSAQLFSSSMLEEVTQRAVVAIQTFDPPLQKKIAEQAEKMKPEGEKITSKTINKAASVLHATPRKKPGRKTMVEVSAPETPRGGLYAASVAARTAPVEPQVIDVQSIATPPPDAERLASWVESWYEENKSSLNVVPPVAPGTVIHRLCSAIRAMTLDGARP